MNVRIEAAYAEVDDAERARVDALGKELEAGIHARQEASKLAGEEIKAGVTLGPQCQRELLAKLYAWLNKREAKLATAVERKAQPATIPATHSRIIRIEYERVVNFYPGE